MAKSSGLMYESATNQPSGLIDAGAYKGLFGSAFQIQGKSQRVFELFNYAHGKPANLALKADGWQGS